MPFFWFLFFGFSFVCSVFFIRFRGFERTNFREMGNITHFVTGDKYWWWLKVDKLLRARTTFDGIFECCISLHSPVFDAFGEHVLHMNVGSNYADMHIIGHFGNEWFSFLGNQCSSLTQRTVIAAVILLNVFLILSRFYRAPGWR